MRTRLAILAATAALVVAALAGAACGPPNVEGHIQKPVPPCAAPVTVIHEGDPLPCIPGQGQRLDVLIAVNGNLATAVAKCYGMGGTPQGPATDQTVELTCRQVTT